MITVRMYGLDGVRRGNYFTKKPTRRTEVEAKVRNLKNRKDEVHRETIKGGGDMVVNWIWRLCNMAFENGFGPENWRSAVIDPLYKGKGGRNE